MPSKKFTWVPTRPVEDPQVGEEFFAISRWISNLAYLKPQYYNHSLENGTSTAYAVWGANSSLLSKGTDFPVRMMIECSGYLGYSASACDVNLQIRNAAGTNITSAEAYGGTTAPAISSNPAATWHGFHLIAYEDLAAGTAAGNIGYQLIYKVSASNAYFRGGVKVTFSPLFT